MLRLSKEELEILGRAVDAAATQYRDSCGELDLFDFGIFEDTKLPTDKREALLEASYVQLEDLVKKIVEFNDGISIGQEYVLVKTDK